CPITSSLPRPPNRRARDGAGDRDSGEPLRAASESSIDGIARVAGVAVGRKCWGFVEFSLINGLRSVDVRGSGDVTAIARIPLTHRAHKWQSNASQWRLKTARDQHLTVRSLRIVSQPRRLPLAVAVVMVPCRWREGSHNLSRFRF